MMPAAIHDQACRCRACHPASCTDRPLVGWNVVALVAVAGTAALLFDAGGFTPWLAGLLGMLR
ncbi:hypothetical protein [Sphingomonas sp. NFR15]|uniref:hypothetical protein n=1 Tax=Sphingomonas sp. NFR15 TaxID=1566282 RepID=UPI000882DF78|nr:hypothetical protein [Sphingomonas sp. NFR15]SDA21749.1 hypothetical protein SAMN03159340_01491 [Sphingomonas sp. NFR15]